MFFCVWFLMYTNIPFCKCVCRRTYFDKDARVYIYIYMCIYVFEKYIHI